MVRKLALVQIEAHQKEIEEINAALAEPLKVGPRSALPSRATLMWTGKVTPFTTAPNTRPTQRDGKRVLKTIWGNSKQDWSKADSIRSSSCPVQLDHNIARNGPPASISA